MISWLRTCQNTAAIRTTNDTQMIKSARLQTVASLASGVISFLRAFVIRAARSIEFQQFAVDPHDLLLTSGGGQVDRFLGCLDRFRKLARFRKGCRQGAH